MTETIENQCIIVGTLWAFGERDKAIQTLKAIPAPVTREECLCMAELHAFIGSHFKAYEYHLSSGSLDAPSDRVQRSLDFVKRFNEVVATSKIDMTGHRNSAILKEMGWL